MAEEHFCTICETKTQGTYCSLCGQKIEPTKTTVFSMLFDVFKQALDIEKSVFASLFYILIKPKKVILNYWLGYRNYYPSPGKFLLYSLAIVVIHITYVGPLILGLIFDLGFVDAQITFWVLILPVINVATYLTFVLKKINFTQHLVCNLYVISTFLFLLIFLEDIIFLISGFTLGPLLFVIFLTMVFIWNSIVFTKKKKVLPVLFNALISFTLFLAIVFLVLYLLTLISPEAVSFS